jgi:hypothetical protein
LWIWSRRYKANTLRKAKGWRLRRAWRGRDEGTNPDGLLQLNEAIEPKKAASKTVANMKACIGIWSRPMCLLHMTNRISERKKARVDILVPSGNPQRRAWPPLRVRRPVRVLRSAPTRILQARFPNAHTLGIQKCAARARVIPA